MSLINYSDLSEYTKNLAMMMLNLAANIHCMDNDFSFYKICSKMFMTEFLM
jgi:hypothetical protein